MRAIAVMWLASSNLIGPHYMLRGDKYVWPFWGSHWLGKLRRGVVYEVPCAGCNQVYIGETGRNLSERLKEHKYALKRCNMNNGIAAHAWNTKHPVDWNSARVRTSEQQKRRVLEAILIKQTPNNSNLDCGLNLNQIWSPLLDWISHPIIHHMLTPHLPLPTHLRPPFPFLHHNTHSMCTTLNLIFQYF